MNVIEAAMDRLRGRRADDVTVCHCAVPALRDDDPESFCWRCLRIVVDQDDPEDRLDA